jgi:hypothetical protein
MPPDSNRTSQTREVRIMDAHFREYLAAVAGIRDVYGEAGDDRPTEFHDDTVPATTAAAAEEDVVAGSSWDV